MNLLFLTIIGATLIFLCFIILKIATSSVIPNVNINTKFNNNNKIIKNSFNTTINNSTDNSLHINTFSKNSSSSDDSLSNFFLIVVGFIILNIIIIYLYNKYQIYFEFFTIISLNLYIILLGIYIYKNYTSIVMLLSLFISILSVYSLIYFYFFPLYIPQNIEVIYSASNLTIPFVWNNFNESFWLVSRILSVSAMIVIFFRELIYLFKNKINNYKNLIISKIIFFILIVLFTSGLIHKIIYLLNNLK